METTEVERESPTGNRLRVEQNVGSWLGMPLTRYHGRLAELATVIPAFERRPFELPRRAGRASRANEYYHSIVRAPMTTTEAEVPVGIVSRSYRLIQHREVLGRVVDALTECRICIDIVDATVSLTTYGERMALSIVLPDEERFRYEIGTMDAMRFRIECFNSVDRSTKFMAVMGWLRFVCQNGLIIGRTLAYIRGAHTQQLDAEDIRWILRDGLQGAQRERAQCDAWRAAGVTQTAVQQWADGPLRRVWGAKAAARAYAICCTGRDIVLADPFEKAPPSQRSSVQGAQVPGAPPLCSNAFDAAQVLSWLAGQRRDLGERLEWTRRIPSLIEELVG